MLKKILLALGLIIIIFLGYIIFTRLILKSSIDVPSVVVESIGTKNTETENKFLANEAVVINDNDYGIKGLVYKVASENKGSEISRYYYYDIYFKNLLKNENLLISSSTTEATLSFDQESVYTAKVSGNTLEISKYLIADKTSNILLNNNYVDKIEEVQLFSDKEGRLFFLIFLSRPLTYYNDQGQMVQNGEYNDYQQLFVLNEQSGIASMIYESNGALLAHLNLLTVNGNDIYLSQSNFESVYSLVKINLISKETQDISEREDFGLDRATVSPNHQYIAMLAYTNYGNDMSLSIYDVLNNSLIKTKLATSSVDEFLNTFNFRYLSWDENSSFLYAAVGRGDQFFNLQPKDSLDYKYYFINLDGSVVEQPKLKELENNIQIAKLLDRDTALVVKIESRGDDESLLNQKINLDVFDLKSYQSKSVLLTSIFPYSYEFSDNIFVVSKK